MKVALINNAPNYTGIGKYVQYLFQILKNKIQIDYYYMNFEMKRLDIHNSHSSKAIEIKNILTSKRLLFYVEAARRIPRNYDIYHIASQELSFLNFQPKIITCHDIIRRLHPRSIREYLKQFFIYSGLKNADEISADSHNTKKDLVNRMKIPEHKITVVHLGVDNKIFKPRTRIALAKIYKKYGLSPERKYLLHISSEEPRKNFSHILSVFAQIQSELPEYDILKVGNVFESDRKRHDNFAAKLGIKNRVIRISKVPEKELPYFYNIAEVFLFPSSYEGFGLPLLEAMSSGCPTISYNTSSIPEIVGKAQALIPAGSNHLKQSLLEILRNKKIHKEFSQKGIKQASKFTWDKCARKTLEIYKTLSG